MPSFVPGASAMSCSDYNCGTVLHGIFRIQADDDALRGQVRSPPSAQNGLLRRSATEQIWDSGRMTGKWEFIGSSIGLVPTNGLGGKSIGISSKPTSRQLHVSLAENHRSIQYPPRI